MLSASALFILIYPDPYLLHFCPIWLCYALVEPRFLLSSMGRKAPIFLLSDSLLSYV